ncbi:MAG: hypothetical protein GY798_20355, partial [Hyphomicrobiales bacterium]|nr:hypothetical protein [Hyphomicrobiales bacterium]
ALNMEFVGYSDQGGRADGVQVMVSKGVAYVGHLFSGGFSILDVSDPRDIRPIDHIGFPGPTWSQHLQTNGDLLLTVNMKDMYKHEQGISGDYYKGSIGDKLQFDGDAEHCAGMRIYDISDRKSPKEIAFLEIPGLGVHRIWYDGGRWAYCSALPPGFSDDIMLIIDLNDPAKPEVVSQLWLPGMNTAAGEKPSWNPEHRYALHHPIVKGDLACASWRDGGMTTIDVSDRHAPRILAHDNPAPPFAGGTHNVLPLPDRGLAVCVEESTADNCEDGIKRNWVYDIREPTNPVTISSMPIPDEVDYKSKGGQFGPHNIHENREESFQSSELVFITYQNAGIRAYDISNPFRPEQVGAFVPPAPSKLMDHRPDRPYVIDTTDVYVSKDGLIYCTDFNAGLFVLRMN